MPKGIKAEQKRVGIRTVFYASRKIFVSIIQLLVCYHFSPKSNNFEEIIYCKKEFSSDFNPSSDFAAILTCSSADEACPMVLGCDKRIAITYEDPKKSDGTSQQTETYLERSLQINLTLKSGKIFGV